MSDKRIRAVLFDLGDTLLNFGKFKTFPLISQGARASYDFLSGQGQPVGNFQLYFSRNLLSLRLRRLFSSITHRDFDVFSLEKRQDVEESAELSSVTINGCTSPGSGTSRSAGWPGSSRTSNRR